MTAAERRAAGEATFCACWECRYSARSDLYALAGGAFYMSRHEHDRLAALLRALVLSTLLVTLLPAGWCEP